MNEEVAVAEKPDVPPAGTPCSVCKALGHFCPADQWCAGDSGYAICDECLNGKECETVAARKSAGVQASSPVSKPSTPARRTSAEILQSIRGPFIRRADSMSLNIKGQFRCPDGVSLDEYRMYISEILENDDDLSVYHWRVARLVGTDMLVITKGEEFEDVMGRPRDEDEDDPLKTPAPPGSKNLKVTEEIKRGILSEIPCGEPGFLSAQTIADKYGVSQATVYNVRAEAVRIARRTAREQIKQDRRAQAAPQPVECQQDASEMSVNVSETSAPEPHQGEIPPSVSQAFNIVIREMEGNIDICRQNTDNDDDSEIMQAIKSDEAAVETLRGWHPGPMGMSNDKSKSLYDLALERAKSELHVLRHEARRAAERIAALEAIEKALAANVAVEHDTR